MSKDKKKIYSRIFLGKKLLECLHNSLEDGVAHAVLDSFLRSNQGDEKLALYGRQEDRRMNFKKNYVIKLVSNWS